MGMGSATAQNNYDYESSSSGNWRNASTWNQNSAPPSAPKGNTPLDIKISHDVDVKVPLGGNSGWNGNVTIDLKNQAKITFDQSVVFKGNSDLTINGDGSFTFQDKVETKGNSDLTMNIDGSGTFEDKVELNSGNVTLKGDGNIVSETNMDIGGSGNLNIEDENMLAVFKGTMSVGGNFNIKDNTVGVCDLDNASNWPTANVTGDGASVDCNGQVNGSLTASNADFIGNNTGFNKDDLTYGSNSTLVYDQGGDVTTGDEWPNQASDAPATIKVENGTNLTLNGDRTIDGDLQINDGELDTDSYKLTLNSGASLTESPGNYVVGEVEVTRNIKNGSSFGGAGVTISDENVNEDITLTRLAGDDGKVKANGVEGIARQWQFSGDLQNTDHDITFKWPKDDDNSKDISNVEIWDSNDGNNWSALSSSPEDADDNAGSGNDKRSLTENISELSGYYTATSQNNPLPVELMHFEAHLTNEGSQLQWATASETNNKHFQVQKQVEGEWENIGTVKGNGTTIEKQTYNFQDPDVKPGQTYYYRLKQVDFDGSYEYSDVKAVTISAEGQQDEEVELKLYPNPVSDQLTLKVNGKKDAGRYQLQIRNSSGRLVHRGMLTGSQARVAVSDWQRGLRADAKREWPDLPKALYQTVSIP